MHVKQQHNVCFFVFKFTLKYMLGHVYINNIHARQSLYPACKKNRPHNFQKLPLFLILYNDLFKFLENQDKEFKFGPMYSNFP